MTESAQSAVISETRPFSTAEPEQKSLGVRLLVRTTRDVAPTAMGQRPVQSIEHHFEGIRAKLQR
ncbi:hypothetical protein [Rhizobium leguminosarum]|uniref:hypothetical protein n=1 Tax=Rhizobium leguminosarum TaxID=384 RepID=UPI003D7C311B